MSTTVDYEPITASDGVQRTMGRLRKLLEEVEEQGTQQQSLAITITLEGEGSEKVELDGVQA